MLEKMETTAPIPPAATGGEQSSIHTCEDSIPNPTDDDKQALEELLRKLDCGTNPTGLDIVSMTELQGRYFERSPAIMDGLLSVGTFLFTGAPKIGKSWLMLQLAYHVSRGLPLWGFPVRQGEVLYLSLEDTLPRLQKRLMRMFAEEDSDTLYFATRSGTLNGKLTDQLTAFTRRFPRTGLIIIDTLQRVRDMSGEAYSYASDYKAIRSLKEFTDTRHLCLLLVHHTRKEVSEDAFNMISGTNGLLGAADGAFVLYKDKRMSRQAILEVVGRDQPDQRLHLEFNREGCLWAMTEAEENYKEPVDPVLEAVAGLVSGQTTLWIGTATEHVGCLNAVSPAMGIQPNALVRRLNIYADRLLSDYSIGYQNRRKGDGKLIVLQKECVR